MRLTRHPDGSYQVWDDDTLVGGVVTCSTGNGWYYCDVDGYVTGSARTRGEAAERLVERTRP